jgi:hypothetical protein
MVHVPSRLVDLEVNDVRIDSSGAPRIFDGGGGVAAAAAVDLDKDSVILHRSYSLTVLPLSISLHAYPISSQFRPHILRFQ